MVDLLNSYNHFAQEHQQVKEGPIGFSRHPNCEFAVHKVAARREFWHPWRGASEPRRHFPVVVLPCRPRTTTGYFLTTLGVVANPWPLGYSGHGGATLDQDLRLPKRRAQTPTFRKNGHLSGKSVWKVR